MIETSPLYAAVRSEYIQQVAPPFSCPVAFTAGHYAHSIKVSAAVFEYGDIPSGPEQKECVFREGHDLTKCPSVCVEKPQLMLLACMLILPRNGMEWPVYLVGLGWKWIVLLYCQISPVSTRHHSQDVTNYSELLQ